MIPSHFSVLNAQRLRAGRAPGVLIATEHAVTPLTQKTKPTLLVALGYNLEDQEALRPYISLYGSAQLAVGFGAIDPVTGRQITEETERLVRAIGELVAIWTIDQQQYTVEERDVARAYIDRFLAAHPPTPNDFISGLRMSLDIIRNTPGDITLTQAEWNDALGTVENREPVTRNKRRCLFFQLRLNCVAADLIADHAQGWDAFVTSYTNLELNISNVVIPLSNTIAPAADFNDLWAASTTVRQLSHYERLGFTRETETRSILIAALLAYVTFLTKGENVTMQWRRRHIEQLEKLFPGLNISDLIPDDFFIMMDQIFPKANITTDGIYNGLCAVYGMCSGLDIGPVKWIIEQGALQNVAVANAFCDAIYKNRNSVLDALIDTIPDGEFAALATLIGHLTYDRYCSLVDPPVPMAQYADLAYIGKFITFQQRDPNASTTYKGNPLKSAVFPVTTLREIANSLIKTGSAVLRQQLDPITLIEKARTRVTQIPANLMNQEQVDFLALEMLRAGTDLYCLPTADLQRHLNALPADERRDFETNLTRGLRTDWTPQLRALPMSAKKLSDADIITLLQKHKSPKAKALQTLCDHMVNIGNQVVINPYPNNTRMLAVQRRQIVPMDVLEAITVLGGTIRQEWTVAPPPIPDVAGANYRQDNIDVLSRDIN